MTLEVVGKGRDPLSLVNVAAGKRAEANRHATRHGDPFLKFEAVWCVCDVDQHATLEAARVAAAGEGVMMAVSNPCFELWFLLHFEDHNAESDASALCRRLKKHIPDYDKSASLDDLRSGYTLAVTRAQKLRREAERDRAPGRNPTTDVDLLTESLRVGAPGGTDR